MKCKKKRYDKPLAPGGCHWLRSYWCEKCDGYHNTSKLYPGPIRFETSGEGANFVWTITSYPGTHKRSAKRHRSRPVPPMTDLLLVATDVAKEGDGGTAAEQGGVDGRDVHDPIWGAKRAGMNQKRPTI
jgi:hypothetical protein